MSNYKVIFVVFFSIFECQLLKCADVEHDLEPGVYKIENPENKGILSLYVDNDYDKHLLINRAQKDIAAKDLTLDIVLACKDEERKNSFGYREILDISISIPKSNNNSPFVYVCQLYGEMSVGLKLYYNEYFVLTKYVLGGSFRDWFKLYCNEIEVTKVSEYVSYEYTSASGKIMEAIGKYEEWVFSKKKNEELNRNVTNLNNRDNTYENNDMKNNYQSGISNNLINRQPSWNHRKPELATTNTLIVTGNKPKYENERIKSGLNSTGTDMIGGEFIEFRKNNTKVSSETPGNKKNCDCKCCATRL